VQSGCTALICAAEEDNTDCVKVLVENKAKLDLQNKVKAEEGRGREGKLCDGCLEADGRGRGMRRRRPEGDSEREGRKERGWAWRLYFFSCIAQMHIL